MGIDFYSMTTQVFLGLSFFLFGMMMLEQSLKAVAGERMKAILGGATKNRFVGVATGAGVTAVIQSSSVTTVLVVGFISAGLMSLEQSIAVIIGSNVGTTITSQIVAFKVTKYAALMVIAGFGMLFIGGEKLKEYGRMLMGLGIIFFGMGLMSKAMSPLRDFEPFLEFMVGLDVPIYGILAGALFTALIQSSSATTGIVIVLATQGLVSLEAGIALALGSNLGTCATAGLASIGKPREAVRAALVHLLFNSIGVLLWVFFIPQLAEMSMMLSDDLPRQIANSHTIFNVANTVIMIGFTTQLAWLVNRLIPTKPQQ